MIKQVEKIPPPRRGPGRPPSGGRGLGIMLRAHAPLLAAIDAYIAAQPAPIARAAAVRQIVTDYLGRRGFLKVAK
jgi:hypothetical protein